MAETHILMLELDAFCEHTMQQNTIASPRAPWGDDIDPLAVFKGSEEGEWKGKGKKGVQEVMGSH